MSNNLTSCTNLAVSGNITTSSIISTTSQANTLNTSSITTNTLSLSGNDLSSTLNNQQNSINTLNTNYTNLNSSLANYANKSTTNTFTAPQTFTKNPSDSPFMITLNGTSDGSKPYDGCIVMYGANNTTTGSGVGLVMNPQGFGNPASFILSFVESGGNNITFATRNTNRMIIKNDGKIGIGTTTPSQMLDVSGNVNISGNLITSGSISFSNGSDLTTSINTIESQITTAQSQITSLQNSLLQQLPQYGTSNPSQTTFGTTGKYYPTRPIQISLTNKTGGTNPMYLSQPITFHFSYYFFKGDTSTPGQCCFDLMLMPICLQTWGTAYTNTYKYEFNNNINGNGSFGYSDATYAPYGRQFWTFNQNFQTTTGGAGILYAQNTTTNNYQTHTIYIVPLTNYTGLGSMSCQALDISGASGFTVNIFS
jgi:hypothetical protein